MCDQAHPSLCPSVGLNEVKKAGSAPRRTEEPQRQTVGSSSGEADPSGEEDKPRDSDCRPDREVRVELQGSELWKRFYEIGTEMIITKAGRYKNCRNCGEGQPWPSVSLTEFMHSLNPAKLSNSKTYLACISEAGGTITT